MVCFVLVGLECFGVGGGGWWWTAGKRVSELLVLGVNDVLFDL